MRSLRFCAGRVAHRFLSDRLTSAIFAIILSYCDSDSPLHQGIDASLPPANRPLLPHIPKLRRTVLKIRSDRFHQVR